MSDPIQTESTSFQHKICSEIFLAFRFGFVGTIATVIHMLAVWVLIEHSSTPILTANLVAFLAAFSFSFAGNYYWTFRRPGHCGRTIRRFFLISACAFSANTVLLATLLDAGFLSPLIAALCAAMIIPVITFLACRFWGFNNKAFSLFICVL